MQDASSRTSTRTFARRAGEARTAAPAWTGPAARDRLSSTAFIAALLHGVLILGITFSAARTASNESTSSMEVVLVTSEVADRSPSPDAVLLAQQTLVGSGNAPRDVELRTSLGFRLPTDRVGPVTAGAPTPVDAGESAAEARKPMLQTRATSVRVAEPGLRETLPAAQQAALPAERNAIDVLGRVDDDTVIPDANPRELLISANTRESRIATYLNTWKRKVEEVGTLNFPFDLSSDGATRFPVLEVAVAADGRLNDVRVRTSSGKRALDEAAMDILRLAAPFEPFPANLKSDYDVLRFAYEWQFSGPGRISTRTAAVL